MRWRQRLGIGTLELEVRTRLGTNWTLLGLFPPMRSMSARCATRARVPMTGADARRMLFVAINVRSGPGAVLVRRHARAADTQAFLHELRGRNRSSGTIWLTADRASAHTHRGMQALAEALDIRLLWLPKQASECNPMDHLWRKILRVVAANRQAEPIDAPAASPPIFCSGFTRASPGARPACGQGASGSTACRGSLGKLLRLRAFFAFPPPAAAPWCRCRKRSSASGVSG